MLVRGAPWPPGRWVPTDGCTPVISAGSTTPAPAHRRPEADTIVTGGENVAPAEVEAVLLEHPGVVDAAVFGRVDPEWGEAVVAQVVLADGARPRRRRTARALRGAAGAVQGAQAI